LAAALLADHEGGHPHGPTTLNAAFWNKGPAVEPEPSALEQALRTSGYGPQGVGVGHGETSMRSRLSVMSRRSPWTSLTERTSRRSVRSPRSLSMSRVEARSHSICRPWASFLFIIGINSRKVIGLVEHFQHLLSKIG